VFSTQFRCKAFRVFQHRSLQGRGGAVNTSQLIGQHKVQMSACTHAWLPFIDNAAMSAPGWIECQLKVIRALSPTYWRVVVHALSKDRKSVRVGSYTVPQIYPLRCLETCKHYYEGQLTGHLTARWSSPVDSHISTYPLCRVYEAHIPVSSPLTFISDPTHLSFCPCQHL
jgi:hypothetical protein